MVTEVKAWAAEDGTIHATFLEAAKHDFFKRLTGGDNFKHETVQGIYERRALVLDALRQLAMAEGNPGVEGNID